MEDILSAKSHVNGLKECVFFGQFELESDKNTKNIDLV